MKIILWNSIFAVIFFNTYNHENDTTIAGKTDQRERERERERDGGGFGNDRLGQLAMVHDGRVLCYGSKLLVTVDDGSG